MKLSRTGLLAHIIMPEFDALSDRSTVQWKTNDLKTLGVIAEGVDLTYQVYIDGARTAADLWRMLEEQFNRNTLKIRLIIPKKLRNFKMEAGSRFAVHLDHFKEFVLQTETIGEPLDETRQLGLLLGSLTDEFPSPAVRAEPVCELDAGTSGVCHALDRVVRDVTKPLVQR
ncbi:hypothetical protein PR003_g8837 [Phytophthora rubi]|uniref:Uncharacterized protein n=1 Tax=Phytophthora rubi TaxID=129364 RepID=A0A6A3L119_9STRA|nr:hypothetical protein PR002_g27425 [Phytophthora rubi]KAE9011717.1 hypothetical protein PR001_g15854 [Phytophthora rubi]KAE9343728.1 hypothetical protein PR003_g8837 [Phytophthora rubi]